jgi:MFS family permease
MQAETVTASSPGVFATFSESPVAVKAIFGGVFINRVGGFVSIFLVLFVLSKGRSASEAALALGVYGVGSVVGVLIGGVLADRLGARNATVLSMGSSAVLTAALLYLPNFVLLLAAVGLLGVVSQIFRPASATLLSDLTPEDRQVMVFAMYRFSLNLGTTAAPLLGFALYNLDHKRYTLLFWAEALVALLYAGLALVAIPAKEPAATGGSASATSPGDGSYLAVLRDRRYLCYLVAVLFNAAIYMQYLSTLPLDVRAQGVPLFWYTVAVSLNGFIVIALELPITKLSQKWPLKLTMGLAFGLVGVGVGCYGLPLGPAVIIVGTLIWTIAEVIGAPTVLAYPVMAGPPHLKARYIGSFQFMFGLGSAIGPMVGGLLFTEFGHAVWPLLMIGSVVAVLFGLIGVWLPAVTPAGPGSAPRAEDLPPVELPAT